MNAIEWKCILSNGNVYYQMVMNDIEWYCMLSNFLDLSILLNGEFVTDRYILMLSLHY